MAARTISTITAPPAAPKGLVRINCRIAGQALELAQPLFTTAGCNRRLATAVSASLSAICPSLAVADPGIQPGIEQIDDQIDHDEDKSRQQHQRLHDRDVPMRDSIHHKAPDPI